jgi:hypothetical protein
MARTNPSVDIGTVSSKMRYLLLAKDEIVQRGGEATEGENKRTESRCFSAFDNNKIIDSSLLEAPRRKDEWAP